MGTVFAVRAFARDGGASGAAGAGEEECRGGGTIALVGSGAVCWASFFTNDVRDTFFVACCADARGDVTIVDGTAGEEAEGVVGPIRTVFLASALISDGSDTLFES
jgi:hypothetical protein